MRIQLSTEFIVNTRPEEVRNYSTILTITLRSDTPGGEVVSHRRPSVRLSPWIGLAIAGYICEVNP